MVYTQDLKFCARKSLRVRVPPPVPTMKFILIRHATTAWNLEGRLQGRLDSPLVPQGIHEIQQVTNVLQTLDITQIFSSDLQRARQTAEIINQALRVPLSFDQRLRECSYGKAEGLTLQEIDATFGPGYAVWNRERIFDGYDYRPIGGEAHEQVVERHLSFLDDQKRSHSPQTVSLIVGHGRGLNTLLTRLGYTERVSNAKYCIIDY